MINFNSSRWRQAPAPPSFSSRPASRPLPLYSRLSSISYQPASFKGSSCTVPWYTSNINRARHCCRPGFDIGK